MVASIHSGFKQTREQITGRILSAIRNPLVHVIAHPTGRLIGEREGYDLDMEADLREAAKYSVAMELNAYPLRLDLNDGNLRAARQLGVPVVINTDSHVTTQFGFMAYGVATAQTRMDREEGRPERAALSRTAGAVASMQGRETKRVIVGQARIFR